MSGKQKWHHLMHIYLLAHENMRLILAELSVATVRTAVTFSLMADFENMSTFKPNDYHKSNIDAMLNEVITWGTALKGTR